MSRYATKARKVTSSICVIYSLRFSEATERFKIQDSDNSSTSPLLIDLLKMHHAGFSALVFGLDRSVLLWDRFKIDEHLYLEILDPALPTFSKVTSLSKIIDPNTATATGLSA